MSKILLSHGGGGQKTGQLIGGTIRRYFDDELLARMDDGAYILDRLVLTTDSFVVNPLFFPGGDIGELAVSGTVNDLAVMGAKPLFLSVGFIIEEGFETENLERILASMKKTAEIAGIRIVTGDTKVVEKGKCGGIYINTSGIGEVVFSPRPEVERIEVGDAVLINGPIGLHQIAVVIARGDFGLDTEIASDVAPLWPLVKELASFDIKFMRDPTRGGIAQVLTEIAAGQNFGIEIDESALPITREVSGVCDILGYDILHLANEGKIIVMVPENQAQEVIEIMRKHPLGEGAAIIGNVTDTHRGMVTLKTTAQSERVVMPPTGELLPRIC